MAGACHDYLIYLIIDRFNKSFDFREEGQGVAAAVAEPEGTLGEEGVVIRGWGHQSLCGQALKESLRTPTTTSSNHWGVVGVKG